MDRQLNQNLQEHQTVILLKVILKKLNYDTLINFNFSCGVVLLMKNEISSNSLHDTSWKLSMIQ